METELLGSGTLKSKTLTLDKNFSQSNYGLFGLIFQRVTQRGVSWRKRTQRETGESFEQFGSFLSIMAPATGQGKVLSICLEWFSFECRKTKTKVITLANHIGHRRYIEPIKTRSNYMWLTQSAGKCMRARHNWLWFYF